MLGWLELVMMHPSPQSRRPLYPCETPAVIMDKQVFGPSGFPSAYTLMGADIRLGCGDYGNGAMAEPSFINSMMLYRCHSNGLKVENVSLKFCSRSSSSRKTHLTCSRSAAQRASTRFSAAVISMEQQAGDVSFPGLRQSNLKKSFKLAIRSLLTTCSKEDFMNVFPTLGKAKQETLYLMFIQVISSVHHNIEEEFASICDETHLGTTLDTVEQLVEEQTLDILSNDNGDMTSLAEVKQELSKAKKDRIRYLTSMLEKVVDQNHSLKAQINALNKETLDGSLDTTDAVGRLRSWNSYLL